MSENLPPSSEGGNGSDEGPSGSQKNEQSFQKLSRGLQQFVEDRDFPVNGVPDIEKPHTQAFPDLNLTEPTTQIEQRSPVQLSRLKLQLKAAERLLEEGPFGDQVNLGLYEQLPAKIAKLKAQIDSYNS